MKPLCNLNNRYMVVIVWSLCLFILNFSSGIAQAQTRFGVPVQIEVPFAPTPVKAEGKLHLVYELHLTNFRAPELTLLQVDVVGNGFAGTPLATYTETEITDRLTRPGTPANLTDKHIIGGGMRAVMFLWLTINRADAVPVTLRHRLTFKALDSEQPLILEGAQVSVRRASPLMLGSPLREGMWVAARGPSNASGHRRALIANDGRAYIAQRFAADWMKVGLDRRVMPENHQSKNENWYGYGAEVIAVADAVVSAIKDDIPENVPLSEKMAIPITSETVGGNYVVLNLGGGRYAFYGHLQPKRLRVKVGQKVRKGQLLGFLGNSGNSDAPHLHFHISDGVSTLGAEGLPFVFESFEVLGATTFDPQNKAAGEKRQQEIPLENAVVRFLR
jgi:murein DD-endopeptidase MepM/ murein hydrolase activator NlpD